jgi:hypothetical protein
MLSNKSIARGAEKLQSSVARDFKGGLNTYDSPLNLSTRYSTRLINLYPDSNGRLRLRYGVGSFADLNAIGGVSIIAMYYYNTAIITVLSDGRIYTVDASGNYTARWNTAIAATRPGAPSAWSPCSFASFTPFEGSVVICNGIDKPLIMDELYAVNYLADPATGSNVNVPRAKYCTTHNGYLILAVTATDISTLYIGARGVAGTFEADGGADNDGVDFDTSAYIDVGSPEITGLASFRDSLIVSYGDALLSLKLGTYVDGDHVPTVADTIPNIGALNHNCITAVGETCYFLSTSGLKSLRRSSVNGLLQAQNESTLIGTDLRKALQKFTQENAERYISMLHDTNLQHVMMFVPKLAQPTVRTDNDVYVLCYDKLSKFNAFTQYENMPYRTACRSREGRLFLSSGAYIYRMYNEIDPGYTDPMAPTQQPWSDGTYFTDGTGFYEANNTAVGYISQPWDDGIMWDDGYGWQEFAPNAGVPIEFQWWLPWADMREPARSKESRYLSVDAEGTIDFSINMLTDRISVPLLSMTMRNTIQPSAASGIRPSNNEQLYAWPMRFNRMSLQVNGRAQSEASFISLSVLYLTGGYRR